MISKKLEQILNDLNFKEFSKEEFIKRAFISGLDVEQASIYFNKRVMEGKINSSRHGKFKFPIKYH